MKTIRRNPFSVKQLDYDDIDYKYFNHVEWKGIEDNGNFTSADQQTFADCNNMYIDKEGVLRSRPSIKSSKLFDGLFENNNIEFIQEFGNIIVVLTYQDDLDKIYTINFVYVRDNFSELKNQYVLSNTDTIPFIVLADEKIYCFIKTTTTENDKLISFDIGTFELNQDAKSDIYIPVTKVYINNSLYSTGNETPNEIDLGEKVEYIWQSGSDGVTLDEFISYYLTQPKHENSEIIINEEEFPYEINRYTPQVVAKPVRTISEPDNVYVEANVICETHRNENSMYASYSIDGGTTWRTTTPITFDNYIGFKEHYKIRISGDGTFLYVYKVATGKLEIYAYSVNVDASGTLLYPDWTKLTQWSEFVLGSREWTPNYDFEPLINVYSDQVMGIVSASLSYGSETYYVTVNILKKISQTEYKAYTAKYTTNGGIDNETKYDNTGVSDKYYCLVDGALKVNINGDFITTFQLGTYISQVTKNKGVFAIYDKFSNLIENTTGGTNSGAIGGENTRNKTMAIFDDKYGSFNHQTDVSFSIVPENVYCILNSKRYDNTLSDYKYGLIYGENYKSVVGEHQVVPVILQTFYGANNINAYTDGFITGDLEVFGTSEGLKFRTNNYETIKYLQTEVTKYNMRLYSANPLVYAYKQDNVWELYSSYSITSLTIINTFYKVLKFPQFINHTELDKHFFSSGKTIYISSTGAKTNRDFMWYLPKLSTKNFDYNITALHPISTTEIAVFLENSIYYCTPDTDSQIVPTLYLFYKSRIPLGVKQGSEIITTYDNKYTIFATIRGLVAMSYQDFINSTEQALTYLSDTISSRFDKWNVGPVKLFQYKFWIICYRTDSTTAYVLDMRNTSWWSESYKLNNVSKIIEINYKPYLLIDNDLKYFETSSDNYYDGDTRKTLINWFITSQKLHLSAINYYKHIVSLTLSSITDKPIDPYSSDNQTYGESKEFTLRVVNYRKTPQVGKNTSQVSRGDTTVEMKVAMIRVFTKRLNYYKVNEFQYTISDMNISNSAQLSTLKPITLTNITLKYLITGQVR